MALLLAFTFLIVCSKLSYSIGIESYEKTILYDELDRIDNEIWRLNVILNELSWNKTKILRRLRDITINAGAIAPPTFIPTAIPTQSPTKLPTNKPTKKPSKHPTTARPTVQPTVSPTNSPTLDLNPIRDNIQKSKSRKNTKSKKKSASSDKHKEEQLLNHAISSKQISSTKVVRLYACDTTSKDWNEDTVMNLFETQVLMRSPQNNFLILGDTRWHDIKHLPNNTLTAGHITDVFLTRFIDSLINRMVSNKISAAKLKEYVIKSIERLLILDMQTEIIDRVLTRMHDLPRTTDLAILESYVAFHCGSLMYAGIPALDFNASWVYNEMLYFLQYVFEEVVNVRITHSLNSMVTTPYAQSGKVPEDYEAGLLKLQESRLVQNAVTIFFESARLAILKDSSNTISHIFVASVQLRKALHVLQMSVLSFSIAEIIFEWMESGQNHQVISISDGAITLSRMIDLFLYNLGYNDSQIERYKVKPIGKGNKLIANRFDIPPASFEKSFVKIKKYKDGERYLFERQLLEANDDKNDLVIILAPNVIREAMITAGRYSMMTEFDIECAEIMAVFMDFLQLVNRKPFDNEGKVMVRSLISVIIYSLTTLDEHFFVSSVYELELAKAHIKECEEFSKIVQIGYKMMNQSRKFIELKMIQIGGINDASLDVMLTFIEVAIKQLYIVNMKILEGFMENSTLIESNSGPMVQLFINWNAIKSSLSADISRFEKFMNGLKRQCIEGGTRQGRKVQNIKPDIIEKMNGLRVTKWLHAMCSILYEWKHEAHQMIVFIAYDEQWLNYFDDENLFKFLGWIGFKNVGTNDEKRELTYEY